MNDEDKEKIDIAKNSNEEENKIEEKQSEGENTTSETPLSESSTTSIENQEQKQPESEQELKTSDNETSQSNENYDNKEEKKEHEVIHKKDGRLHIYVRQDKYKGELKSKNWVGRLYKDGKQKIYSSGTPNLEEAIPILEKWFDDVHAEKQVTDEQTTTSEKPAEQIQTTSTLEKKVEPVETSVKTTSENISPEIEETKKPSSILEKFKNIKLKKPSFGKKDSNSNISRPAKNNFKNKIASFFKSKIGKSAVQGEEIVGVEITNKEIRLAQISSNKANQWILDKFFLHPLNLPEDSPVLENSEKIGEELSIALQKSKIATPNAAIAIPVTSAIIRVVTAPLMKDEELQKAIETNSLWENLVQLTDNLDDYSIFHQVINRNDKENTMDILFVASKLADINNFTSIIKGSGLNPVIIDVKCFALKSAVDQINQISNKSEDTSLTAVLEFGLDENYLMILYNNNPIITDIFLRGQDRKILMESKDQEEKEGLVRRFITQVKQAIQDFETKYEKRIRNIKVVSDLQNVEEFLSTFRKTMTNVGFNLFDPLEGLKIPQQLENSVTLENKSYLSTVVGLAFRKLDVFGYYKFVTAVKNINLLPDRSGMIKQKKMKAFSNFAFKGVVGVVVALYVVLFGLSFWQIQSYNHKLTDYNQVIQQHQAKVKQKKEIDKELGAITKTLQLSKTLKSNKSLTYRVLAQIAMSVPKRVKFDSVKYDGKRSIIIQGFAASDQDILKLITNLGKQKLIKQASLSSMQLPRSSSGQQKKGFKIFVNIKG